MQSKTFEEFWQVFLQVTFHQGHPERWTKRESKAQWLQSCLELTPGDSIADLGCGDGILDICLARMGYIVTAVDRSPAVLKLAQKEDDTKSVHFQTQDLKQLQFPANSFNAIIIHETIGLMSFEDDRSLLARAYTWLKPGGRLMVDCPLEPSLKNDWSKEFVGGRVDAFTSFDLSSRTHRLNFEFHPKEGEAFNLYDPNSLERHAGPGITRYIYTQSELQKILQKAGFSVFHKEHFYGPQYFASIGVKGNTLSFKNSS